MTDYRNEMTEAAVWARGAAALVGRELGEALVSTLKAMIEQNITDPNYDPYLEGLIYTNAAQVIASEGRRIAGLDFTKQDRELEGRKAR